MSATRAGESDNVYAELERYDWDGDVEFQSGLSAILGSNSSSEQSAELALRARCFYYARKFNTTIDFDAYKAYRDSHGSPPPQTAGVQPLTPTATESEALSAPANPAEPPAPYPTSFAHIVELITTGQPIPGIKDIPDTVLAGQGTQPEKPRRKKPWEKDEPQTGAELGGAA